MINQNIDLSENLCKKWYGTLEIHEIHGNGDKVIRHAPNIITFEARRIMAYLISGEQIANKFVRFLRVGDDSTAPTRSNTALGNQVDSVLVTYTFPDVDRVVFEGVLPNITAANGSTLREAGLFNNDDQMFSRQAHGDIEKTSAIQLKYIWTIIFT